MDINQLKCGDFFVLFQICAFDDDQQINWVYLSAVGILGGWQVWLVTP